LTGEVILDRGLRLKFERSQDHTIVGASSQC